MTPNSIKQLKPCPICGRELDYKATHDFGGAVCVQSAYCNCGFHFISGCKDTDRFIELCNRRYQTREEDTQND